MERILHRIYFGFDGEPDPYGVYLKTWEEKLPDFKIMKWNSENLPLDICFFSKMMFDLKDHAFLSDYFRWWVLREHGGVYLDADIEIINPQVFDNIVSDLESSDEYHSFIGVDNKSGGWYTGHSVGSLKNSPLSRFMCETYEGMGNISLWRRKIFYFMSPQITSLYFAFNGHNVEGMGTTPNLKNPMIISGVKVYPQEFFSPLTPVVKNGFGGFEIDSYTKNTAICHHFSCSWHDADSIYLNSKDLNFLKLDEKTKLLANASSISRGKFYRISRNLWRLMRRFPSKLKDVMNS